jgi:hypothetical protein
MYIQASQCRPKIDLDPPEVAQLFQGSRHYRFPGRMFLAQLVDDSLITEISQAVAVQKMSRLAHLPFPDEFQRPLNLLPLVISALVADGVVCSQTIAFPP